MKKLTLLFFLFICVVANASTVDTVSIFSSSMKKNIKAVVIKPDSYKKEKAFPVVYLLHGYSGRYDNWIKLVPQLNQHADRYEMIIVCPDGDYGSWYFDSPVDTTMRYETFIAKEVPAFIDKNYSTIKDRKGRAITGLSMGGHGGLFLAFRHKETFSGCGSMSGALMIEFITDKRYGIGKLLGDTTNKDRYRAYSIMKEMETYQPKDSIAIMIDCGREDFIFEMSKAVHDKMVQLKIPHDYIERPGKHDWNYWGNAVQYQLLFFRNHFDKTLNSK
jgi:S-formylglutathione hydrolase FrmB